MDYPMEQIKEIVKKVIDNDFETDDNYKLMTLNINNQIIELNDYELGRIMGYNGCTVKERAIIAKGKSAEEFYNSTGTHIGYQIFNLEKHPEYREGAFIEDSKKHGIYFTIQKEELFRFIFVSYFEKFGAHIAEISLKHNEQFVPNAAVSKDYDTQGTYRARCFYVEKIYSVNDYKLISHLFNIAPDWIKNLIVDDSENGFYNESIKYYKEKGCDQIVKAIVDIHNSYRPF